MKLKTIITNIVIGTRNEVIRWIELVVISAISVLIWRYQNTISYDAATDYFFWPAVGPVLVSLRYGFGKGLISDRFSTLA